MNSGSLELTSFPSTSSTGLEGCEVVLHELIFRAYELGDEEAFHELHVSSSMFLSLVV